MDPFSRLHSILESTCPACQAPLESGALTCAACGAALDEPDETLNVVIGEETRRIAVAATNNNLSRLLGTLVSLERREIPTSVALAAIDPVLQQFRDWRDQVASLDLGQLNDVEQEMFGYHAPLSMNMVIVLEAWRRAIETGDLEGARELSAGLADGFTALEALLNRYAA